MRNLLALLGLGVTVWWIASKLIAQMPPDGRRAMDSSLAQAKGDLARAMDDLRTYLASQSTTPGNYSISKTIPTSEMMTPGFWSIRVDADVNGQVLTNSGSRCVAPSDIQNLMSGDGGGLLEFPGGSGCGVQQSLRGRQLVGNGQCSVNGMVLQLSSTITFDTNAHFSAQMEESATGQLPFHMSGSFEGTRIGACQ